MTMLETTTVLKTFEQLRLAAQGFGPKRLGVVVADDDVALTAAACALELGIAQPVLLGDAAKTRAKAEDLGLHQLVAHGDLVATDTPAKTATQLAAAGEVDILLKGHLRTDELLHAVLDKQGGLRTGRLLSDVLLYEDVLADERRLVGITDGGLNVAPNLEQKKQIVQNAISVMHCLGIARPKIALMSATEAISESLPSTVDAKALSEMAASGQFGEADVFGPLALDCALLESAARAKGPRTVLSRIGPR